MSFFNLNAEGARRAQAIPGLGQDTAVLPFPTVGLPGTMFGAHQEDYQGSRSLFDVTIGAAEYGGAHAVSAISKFVSRKLTDDETNWVSTNMDEFQRDHPEYSPAKINSAMDLLTSPGALSSRIFAGLPMMGATIGASLIPLVGRPLAFGLNYALGAQDARERALADGASPDQADWAGTLTGTVYGALSILRAEKIVDWAAGSFPQLAKMVLPEVKAALAATKVTGSAAKSVILGATIGAVQNGLDQLIPLGVYGRKVDEDWAQQQLESALVGGATAGLTHLGVGMFSSEPTSTSQESTKVLDAYSRASLHAQLVNQFKYQPHEADFILNLTDAHAKVWAESAGKDPAEWYTTHLTDDPSDLQGSMVLAQDAQKVGGFYSKLLDAADRLPQDKWTSQDLAGFLRNKAGIKPEELEWTGTNFLLSQVKSITKPELVSYLEKNQVKLAEVYKGIDRPMSDEVTAKLADLTTEYDQIKDKHTQAFDQLMQATGQLAEKYGITDKQIPWSQYPATPEELQKIQDLSDARHKIGARLGEIDGQRAELRNSVSVDEPLYESYTLPGPKTNYREILIRFPRYAEQDTLLSPAEDGISRAVDKSQELDLSPDNVHNHWTEKNVLAHIRLSDRLLPDGSKLSLIEEVQSDWHQAGKEQGYKQDVDPQVLQQKEEEYQKLLTLHKEKINENTRQRTKALTLEGEEGQAALQQYRDGLSSIHLVGQDLAKMKSELTVMTGGVEKAPFQKSWEDLGVRRAILDVVENGSDYIGLTTGQQQVERYAGMDPEHKPGMIDTYDNIMRKKLLKEVQKLDPGARIEWVPVANDDYRVELAANRQDWSVTNVGDKPLEYHAGFTTEQEAQAKAAELNRQLVPAIKISDQVRDSVVDGMPLFQRRLTPSSLRGKNLAVALLHDGQVYVMDGDHAQFLAQKEFAPGDVKNFLRGTFDRNGNLILAEDQAGGTGSSVHDLPKPSTEPFPGAEFKPGEYKLVPNEAEYNSTTDLFQPKRGSTTFLRDGRAVIRALQKPNLSTALHELAHVFRRDLVGEDHEVASKWAGAREQGGDWIWDVRAEEKFARGFESYLKDGNAPSLGLQRVFDQFKSWLMKVYRGIRGSQIDVGLSDEIKGVFDRLFVKDTGEVGQARQGLAEARAMHESTVERMKSSPDLFDPNELQARELQVAQAESELRRTQQSQLMPESPTIARQRRDDALEAALGADVPERTGLRARLGEVGKSVQRFFLDKTSGMEQVPAGKETLDRLSDAFAYFRKKHGEMVPVNEEGFKALSKEDKTWLSEHDDLGVTNLQKLIDKAGVPDPTTMAPTAGLQKYYEAARTGFDLVSQEEEANGVLRQVGQSFLPAKGQDVIRHPRALSQNAYEAISRGGGKFYAALMDGIKKLNPDLDISDIHKRLQSMYGRSVVREVGSVEESRKIPYFPGKVQVDGQWIDSMQSEPRQALINMTQAPLRRIGIIREFGQGLKPVERGPLLDLAKALGVYREIDLPTLAKKLEDAGVEREKLYKPTPAADLQGMPNSEQPYSLSTLSRLAKVAGIDLRQTRTELLDAISNTSSDMVRSDVVPALRTLARTMGGIDPKAEAGTLLSELKRRVAEPSGDILEDLRKAFSRQGGSSQQFIDVFRLAQGLPVGWQGEGAIWRGWKATQNVLGGFQTGLAAVPSIPQTLVQVPQLAGVGNYFKAMGDVLAHKGLSRAEGVALGAIPETIFRRASERGYRMEYWGQKIREVLGKPLEWVDDFNNTVSSRAFVRLAEQWQLHGLTDGDMRTARSLKLTDSELGEIKAGRMSDQTFAKIVQNGVSGTQYHSEPMYRRGTIESSPLARSLFAYQNYTLGTVRSSVSMANDVIQSMKSGSTGDRLQTLGRLTVYMGSLLGAGFMSEALRSVVKGNMSTQPLHKDWEHRLTGALAEVGLFGPAQRMLEPLNPDDGDGFDKAFVSIFPQVQTILNTMSNLIGKGTYGKFDQPWGILRMVESSAPVARSIHNWFDNFMYPEHQEYVEARRLTTAFKRDVLGVAPTPGEEAPAKPGPWRVGEMATRFDLDGAVKAAKMYYQEELSKVSENPIKAVLEHKNPIEIASELRQSLLAKSPITLNTDEMMFMLAKLPMSQRRAVLQNHLKYVAIVNAIAPGQ